MEERTANILVTKRNRQRDRIYFVLRNTRSHPTAEWIHEQVRALMPKISLGTVYRNLDILARQGKILELDFGEGTHRYDAFTHEHYHFVCERCGVIKDLDVPPQTDLHDRVSPVVKGTIRTHRLDFFGTCEQCLRLEN